MREDLLKYRVDEVNGYLDACLHKLKTNVPKTLLESIKYSLFAGGKRLRPILLLESAQIFSDHMENVIPLACGIEMIHTYSLIHDDLPAMDNDDYRRGKLTNHNVFGEDMAILAGDALLNYAYELMIEHALGLTGKSLTNYLKALFEISACSGTQGMIIGQVADILNQDTTVNKEMLDFINCHKTGALIKASVRAGATVHGCNPEILNHLTKYSEKIGLAFQIVDDVLDVIGDPNKIGKNTGSDEKNNKDTYIDYYGLQKSKEIIEELLNQALQHLKFCNIHDSLLMDLTYFICRRDF
ncbi:MAG: polyprenyl synthetase family protein [Eubacteriales bacterium]